MVSLFVTRGNQYDTDDSVVFYNSYDPNDASRKFYLMYPQLLTSLRLCLLMGTKLAFLLFYALKGYKV